VERSVEAPGQQQGLARWNEPTTLFRGLNAMSKGKNTRKETKKEPAKTMLEKRAAKRAKKDPKIVVR
jgi:hypothetical protein